MMEIREIRKSKPQNLNVEATVEAIVEESVPAVSDEGKKPRKLSLEEKLSRLNEEPKLEKCQHIKILDCKEPVSRVICECWHCLQGLLIEVEVAPPQYIEAECPTCGKSAIRLQGNQVLSITPIPSPWG